MALNPNWPVIDYAMCWSAGRVASPVQDLWCSVAERTEGSVSITRGKQYELDQVQPSQLTATLRNDDGAFDPANMSSPFAGFVVPYRLFRARAQWSPTVNLLTADQATNGGASGVPSSLTYTPKWVTAGLYYQGNGSPTATPTYLNDPPAGAALGTLLTMTGFSVAPGVTYSLSCKATELGTFGAPHVRLDIQWYGPSGSLLSTSSGAVVNLNGPTVFTASVTATAPANAAGARVLLTLVTAPTGTNSWIQTYQYQLEKAAAPTAYVQPGTWYNFFTGYVERWPQAWSSGGNYGTTALTVVDLYAWFSSLPLQDPFVADLLALGPNFLYQLNEADGTTAFADVTGKRGNALVTQTALSNSLSAGVSIESGDNSPRGQVNAGDTLTGAFLGGQGPVLQTALPLGPVGQPLTGGGALLIPPDPATGLVGTPQSTGWTRLIAVRATGLPPASRLASPWTLQIDSNGQGMQIYMSNVDMQMAAGAQGPNPAIFDFEHYPMPEIANPTTLVMEDTDWHLLGIGLPASGLNLTLFNDDNEQAFSRASTINPVQGNPDQGAADCIGAISFGNLVSQNWIGNLAFACEIPYLLTYPQWQALNRSWRNAWGTTSRTSETSDQRYARILAWAGYTGPTRIDSGDSVAYGPATDIQGGLNATVVLAALQAVVDTEGGEHFVAVDGVPVFQARSDRYNQSPVVTFGEHVGSGEIPYLNAATDFDPTRLGNSVQVTAQYGNAVYVAADAASESMFGQIGISRTVNSMDPSELEDAAEYLLYQNKQPLQRLEALPVDVGANPSAWPSLLGLELGTCVLANRRPSNAPAISIPGYLEQIQWTLNENNSASWVGQISNSALHNFAEFDSAVYGLFDSTLIFGY